MEFSIYTATTSSFRVSCLQVWDRRHGDHPLKMIQCHNGPVYCCIWHPETENVVLTAGRDKMIKVRTEGMRCYVTYFTVFLQF